jgi:hypothetical protein
VRTVRRIEPLRENQAARGIKAISHGAVERVQARVGKGVSLGQQSHRTLLPRDAADYLQHLVQAKGIVAGARGKYDAKAVGLELGLPN